MFNPSAWVNRLNDRAELDGFVIKVAMVSSVLIVGFVVYSFLFCFPAGCFS